MIRAIVLWLMLSCGAIAAEPFVMVVTDQGTGSAFHVGGGKIVTAAHVVNGQFPLPILMVVDEDSAAYPAIILSMNESADVAVLQVIGESQLGSVDVDCDPTFSIGDRLFLNAYTPDMGDFVTIGTVANAKVRKRSRWEGAILVDGTIFPGMSGGAVVRDGVVVGVMVSVLANRFGASFDLGTVVPTNSVCELLGR